MGFDDPVRLTRRRFGGLTATVGGAPATVVSNTSSSVVVLTPPGTTGAAQVVVNAPNGCVVSAPFTYR